MAIYFDNAATTFLSKRAREVYLYTAENFGGNPSSVHREGHKAKEELDRNRDKAASLLGVKSSSVIFTSGATESITAFFSSLLWQEPGEILISKIEHGAVASQMAILKRFGWEVNTLKAKGGFVSAEELREKLTPKTKVVAVMAVNNVTGAIQDIKGLVSVVREFEQANRKKVFFFSDSVQALGKTGLDLTGSDVDGASFSSHKINGPRGVGILYLKNPNAFRSYAPAGGQEAGRRGGTENLPGIAAFTEAISEWCENRAANEERIRGLNKTLREALTKLNLEILSPENSTPYILSIAGTLPSEVFSRMLMDKGFCVSSGSACSNNAKGKSESIYEAMGIKHELARKAIRISFDNNSSEEDVNLLIKAFQEIING